MNSNRNDRSKESQDQKRERRSSYPEEGYNGGYGRSEGEPYRYGEAAQSEYFRGDSRQNTFNSGGNRYGTGGGDYSPGYSTANDFSGQTPVRGRIQSAQHR